MKQCTNLKRCPKCSTMPELIQDELGMIFSFCCPKCANEYGGKMEPHSTLDNLYISFKTYEEVCGLWQRGACKDLAEPYTELKFE